MGIWEWLLLLLLLLFGGTQQRASEPVIIDNGNETSIDSITEYGSEVFQDDDGWYVLETDESIYGSVSVTWTDSQGTVIIYIIDYPTRTYNPNRIFTIDWVENTLEPNYDELEFEEQCEQDDIYLYDYDLEVRGAPYRALMWMFYLNDDYVRNVIFIFPTDRIGEMDEYAEQMFPEFYSCDE
jgi:hypothetical protein